MELNNMLNIDTFSCVLILMNDSKSISMKIPSNIPNNILNLNGTNLNGIIMFEQVPKLNNSGKMPLLKELLHDNGNPIPFLTNNNLAFLGMLGPRPPLPFGFLLSIINEDSSNSN
jgi:hypothetical protein